MSYSVKLTEGAVTKLNSYHLSKHEVREIRQGLNILTTNPRLHLISVGLPHKKLQFDLVITNAGEPRRDALYSFTIRYGADEETLFVVDCELRRWSKISVPVNCTIGGAALSSESWNSRPILPPL